MPKWKRDPKTYLTKKAQMSDGELLHLLVGKTNSSPDDLDDRFYQSMQALKESTGKALLWVIGSTVFCVLAHMQALKAVSAIGLDVTPKLFIHLALLSLSFSTANYCFNFSKQSFYRSWFSFKLKSGTPHQKALALLKYPDAYWHFQYLSASTGFPKYIFSKRRGIFQILSIFLVIIALFIGAFASITIWITLIIDVYLSLENSYWTSYGTIALSIVMILLGWTSPFYSDWPKEYIHYGLSEILNRRSGDRLKIAHEKILRAARRMKLLD